MEDGHVLRNVVVGGGPRAALGGNIILPRRGPFRVIAGPAFFGLVILVASSAPGSAQRLRGSAGDVLRADSLLAAGQMFAAESIYYQASRERPRDPVARLALGIYLAGRGAVKVGSVLMEEARYFGGDTKAVAAALAPVYDRLRDYRALASLVGSPLPPAERKRAEWLAGQPREITGPDSSSLALASPGDTEHELGIVALVVGRDTLQATIDPSVTGLVLDTTMASHSGAKRLFVSAGTTAGADARRISSVSGPVRLGELQLSTVPTRYATIGRRNARLGLDVIEALRPTFDQTAGSLVLRLPADPKQPPRRFPGATLPIYFARDALLVFLDDRLVPITSPAAAPILRGRKWTLDARHGAIVLAPPTR